MTDTDRALDLIPVAEWDVAVWPEGEHFIFGRIDGADRKRLVGIIKTALLAAQAPAQDDDTPSGGGTDGSAAPDAPTGRTRDQARQAAHHAQTQGGQAGIATGLAAIALAILAGQEPR